MKKNAQKSNIIVLYKQFAIFLRLVFLFPVSRWLLSFCPRPLERVLGVQWAKLLHSVKCQLEKSNKCIRVGIAFGFCCILGCISMRVFTYVCGFVCVSQLFGVQFCRLPTSRKFRRCSPSPVEWRHSKKKKLCAKGAAHKQI